MMVTVFIERTEASHVVQTALPWFVT